MRRGVGRETRGRGLKWRERERETTKGIGGREREGVGKVEKIREKGRKE